MTADEIKDALRKRHPAIARQNGYTFVGEWTTLEEWAMIDLLAVSCHGNNRRVGYEIKVSRSDFRREILRPDKRALAVEMCHEFYFAAPAGLLKPDEIEFSPPPEFDEWASFRRTECRYSIGPERPAWDAPLGPCYKGKRIPRFPADDIHPYGYSGEEEKCEGCDGRGYAELSLVEREGPTLWVPRDVGLVTVDGRGTKVAKRAPRRRPAPLPQNPDALFAAVARWVSVRPDPRHEALRS